MYSTLFLLLYVCTVCRYCMYERMYLLSSVGHCFLKLIALSALCFKAQHNKDCGWEVNISSHSCQITMPTFPRAAKLCQGPNNRATCC